MCTFFYKTQVYVVTHSLHFECLEIACALSVYIAAIHERGKAMLPCNKYLTSLMVGLLMIFLARLAYRRVLSVSA